MRGNAGLFWIPATAGLRPPRVSDRSPDMLWQCQLSFRGPTPLRSHKPSVHRMHFIL
jgi:hypothetical protein